MAKLCTFLFLPTQACMVKLSAEPTMYLLKISEKNRATLPFWENLEWKFLTRKKSKLLLLIFYEQFNNVISQSPIVTNISGDPLPWEKGGPQAKYFFEPSLEKIMEFFEKEIFASIFQQTIFESELAKFAARMVSLDFAS